MLNRSLAHGPPNGTVQQARSSIFRFARLERKLGLALLMHSCRPRPVGQLVALAKLVKSGGLQQLILQCPVAHFRGLAQKGMRNIIDVAEWRELDAVLPYLRSAIA